MGQQGARFLLRDTNLSEQVLTSDVQHHSSADGKLDVSVRDGNVILFAAP